MAYRNWTYVPVFADMSVKLKQSDFGIVIAALLTCCDGVVYAGIVNGGFETGDFSGWTLGGGKYDESGVHTPLTQGSYDAYGRYFNSSSDNFDGNLSRSAVVPYNEVERYAPDPYSWEAKTDFKSLNKLNRVYAGEKSLRLNDWRDGGHYSTISQTVNGWNRDSLSFAWSAFLEEPKKSNPGVDGHDAIDSHFIVEISDAKTSQVLFSQIITYTTLQKMGISKIGEEPSYEDGALPFNDTWFYTDWQVMKIDTSQFKDRAFTLKFLASDCGWDGHGGYVYLDNIGGVFPVPEPSTWFAGLAALGMLGFVVVHGRKPV